MAKFKYIPQHFLLKKLVEFWKNMVKNYGGDCHDDDFFDILCGSVPHGKVLDIIEMAYSGKEIHDMEHTRLRYGRLDLSDPIDDIFQTLWNNNKARGKCRIVLETLGDYVVHDLKVDDMDVLARRFKEVKSMLRLDDLELEWFVGGAAAENNASSCSRMCAARRASRGRAGWTTTRSRSTTRWRLTGRSRR